MDRANEREVQDAINKIQEGAHGTTVVVIAHRLSTIKNADKIIVLRKGEVVEEGTHEKLLSVKGLYAQLVRS